MTTDDSDIESSNPSKSFKVGDFDRLSGFFTPVWESKRKLRSESPIPSSSAAASAPSSSRGSPSAKAPAPPTAPSEASSEQAAQTRPARDAAAEVAPAEAPGPKAGTSPAQASSLTSPSTSAPAKASPASASLASAQALAPALASKSSGRPPVEARHVIGISSPLQTGSKARDPRSNEAAITPAQPAANGTLTGVGSPDLQARAAASQRAERAKAPVALEAAPSTPNTGVTIRPMIPMPNLSPRLSVRPKSSSPPSAASAALKQAGPQLTPEAYLDREPEFRQPLASVSSAAKSSAAKPAAAVPLGPGSPPRAERPKLNHRSLRASAAATAIHEKLKAQLQSDSVETLARHRDTDSDREALRAAAERAVATPAETYPLHLLRRLRRTIHLSTPLPESVRAMLSKYRG